METGTGKEMGHFNCQVHLQPHPWLVSKDCTHLSWHFDSGFCRSIAPGLTQALISLAKDWDLSALSNFFSSRDTTFNSLILWKWTKTLLLYFFLSKCHFRKKHLSTKMFWQSQWNGVYSPQRRDPSNSAIKGSASCLTTGELCSVSRNREQK